MKNTLQVGDVVRLRSGSPPLTVIELQPGDKVIVAWFNSKFNAYIIAQYPIEAKCYEIIQEARSPSDETPPSSRPGFGEVDRRG